MNDLIVSALIAAKERYESYYQGSGRLLQAKRLFRYPGKYIRRALAQTFGWWNKTPVCAKTCWGRDLFVLLPDKNAGSLYYFGFLPQQEYLLSQYLARNLEEKDVFYDIGANYGFYSALASTVSSKGGVHVFEPHPLLTQCLRASFPSGVVLNALAVAEKQGKATLYDAYSKRHSGGSTLQRELGETNNAISVSTISLDEYVAGHSAPTIMKIDVEGGEYDVLSGAKTTLELHRPCVIMEVWGRELWDVYSKRAVELLFKLGYGANELTENGSLVSVSPAMVQEKSREIKYRNIIFYGGP